MSRIGVRVCAARSFWETSTETNISRLPAKSSFGQTMAYCRMNNTTKATQHNLIQRSFLPCMIAHTTSTKACYPIIDAIFTRHYLWSKLERLLLYFNLVFAHYSTFVSMCRLFDIAQPPQHLHTLRFAEYRLATLHSLELPQYSTWIRPGQHQAADRWHLVQPAYAVLPNL